MVLELSLREGFDLGPCEALWKRTPVVGGADGGLALTVRDGVDGFLADGAAGPRRGSWSWSAIPGWPWRWAAPGRERVRERFLVTAAAERELRALAELL